LLLGAWFCARRGKLVREDAPPNISDAFVRRVVWAQVLYAIGASLCIFSTWLAIAAIFLVQLNYVLAPRIWPLNKL
jgi:hypothetical protein